MVAATFCKLFLTDSLKDWLGGIISTATSVLLWKTSKFFLGA